MDLKRATCLYFLGKLESYQLPDIATEALIRGVESPSLAALAGESPQAGMAELGPLFERALSELGLQPLKREQTTSLTLWYFAEQLTQPDADPLPTLRVAYYYISDNLDTVQSESQIEMFEDLYGELINIETTDSRHVTEAADLLRQRARSEATLYIRQLMSGGGLLPF